MPRQRPQTQTEEEELRAAVDEFAERVRSAFGDAVTVRPIPDGESSDVEIRLNTREFPTEADGPLDLSPIFEAATDLGFETASGLGYTIADVGTANESSRLFFGFAYTYD